MSYGILKSFANLCKYLSIIVLLVFCIMLNILNLNVS